MNCAGTRGMESVKVIILPTSGATPPLCLSPKFTAQLLSIDYGLLPKKDCRSVVVGGKDIVNRPVAWIGATKEFWVFVTFCEGLVNGSLCRTVLI